MKKNSSLFSGLIGYLDDMTIAKKTSLLFLNMFVGMLFIWSFSYLSSKRLKDNFDILLTKQMLPIIKLENIKDIYMVNIYDTLKEVQKKHISLKEGRDIISLAQNRIDSDWREYKESLSIDETDWFGGLMGKWSLVESQQISSRTSLQKDLTKKIETKIHTIDASLLDIFTCYSIPAREDACVLVGDDLYPNIGTINANLTQLIALALEQANGAKIRTQKVYDQTFFWILTATIGTILVSALLSLVILKNIRILHRHMEQTVDEKTKELQELNANLKEKIAYEVEQSRQKDQIMLKQSRLAAMGEMVGNIAHQWRQPLNALALVVQSFGTKKMVGKLDDAFIDAQVEEGMKLANSMSKTIDDFRNFFKPDKQEELFSLQRVIGEALDLVAIYYQKLGIQIDLICKNDFYTNGYSNEFSQVIMNLLANAKDILSEKKEPEKYIEIIIDQVAPNEGKISVIDNGGGMRADVLERMFEPYFTTKHQNTGTGIGLYMSQEIIEKHMRGRIWAENIAHRFTKNNKLFKKCASINITMEKGG